MREQARRGMLAVSSDKGLFCPAEGIEGNQKMFTYYSAKVRQDQLLQEAERDRLVREIKRAKREAGKHKPAQAKGWINRRIHAAHA